MRWPARLVILPKQVNLMDCSLEVRITMRDIGLDWKSTLIEFKKNSPSCAHDCVAFFGEMLGHLDLVIIQ
jgi:hypothetical protein